MRGEIRCSAGIHLVARTHSIHALLLLPTLDTSHKGAKYVRIGKEMDFGFTVHIRGARVYKGSVAVQTGEKREIAAKTEARWEEHLDNVYRCDERYCPIQKHTW